MGKEKSIEIRPDITQMIELYDNDIKETIFKMFSKQS